MPPEQSFRALPIQVRNIETGAVYQAGTSATGNYTLAQLPAGQYEMTVAVPGFKTYVRQGLTVDVAQTYGVDVTLEVGTKAESVTVTEAAPLLKTDSGELSHNVSMSTVDDLPVLPTGSAAGASGIRNPYSVVTMLPGGTFFPSSAGPGTAGADMTIRINGSPGQHAGDADRRSGCNQRLVWDAVSNATQYRSHSGICHSNK